MRATAAARAALAGCTLVLLAAPLPAQERPAGVPLSSFVEAFTDPAKTTAQKEQALAEGTWYEGAVTVSDVEYFKKQGAEAAHAEIRDSNYRGGCYLLLFRTAEVDKALALRVDDRIVVRGRLAATGVHLSKYAPGCETRFALFKDVEILGAVRPSR